MEIESVQINQHKLNAEMAFGIPYQQQCEEGFKNYLENSDPKYITRTKIDALIESYYPYGIDTSNIRSIAKDYFNNSKQINHG